MQSGFTKSLVTAQAVGTAMPQVPTASVRPSIHHLHTGAERFQPCWGATWTPEITFIIIIIFLLYISFSENLRKLFT